MLEKTSERMPEAETGGSIEGTWCGGSICCAAARRRMDIMKCLDVVPLFDVLGRFALRCFSSFIVIVEQMMMCDVLLRSTI